MAKSLTEVGSGSFHQHSEMTLSQLRSLSLTSKSRPRQSTREGYAGDLRRAFGDHGDRPVQQLTPAELQGWVNSWPAEGARTAKDYPAVPCRLVSSGCGRFSPTASS